LKKYIDNNITADELLLKDKNQDFFGSFDSLMLIDFGKSLIKSKSGKDNTDINKIKETFSKEGID
jgi:hypothetical protein